MPKVSVYLPDDLYQAARARGLSVSALAQRAIQDAVGDDGNAAWIASMRAQPPMTRDAVDTTTLMGQVREEFGS